MYVFFGNGVVAVVVAVVAVVAVVESTGSKAISLQCAKIVG